MIDRATVDRILEAAKIVEVVSDYVSLRKAGVNYKGLCPFHDDTTPSFIVSPVKNICHCFACGKGGTPVGFLMEHDQLTYPEALRRLAQKYHIEIHERELTDEEKLQESERESMLIVNEWAKNYFHDILKNDDDGRAIGMQYFRSRGIRDDIVEEFQLGYAPLSRTAMSTAALKAGYKEEFLVKTGLCYKRENDGNLTDRYAGRVIFPWFNMSGKVVAFGGRLLDARTKGVQQKYVNSPDSDIYHKEQQLYGIYQAKQQIAKEDRVYMVEGYTDVIAMHQCGIKNVVANSGTALSTYQIKMLRRFTQNIILLYDGDEAGIHAAMRGTDMLLAEGMNVKVLVLPDGDDPDSFARKHTATEFRQYLEEHQTDFIQFKSDLLLRGVTDLTKRSDAIKSIVRSISVIKDPIVRDTYITDCAHRLGINEYTLITQLNNYIRNDQEEQRKELERKQLQAVNGMSSQLSTAEAVTAPSEGDDMPLRPLTPAQQASEVATLLVQLVIRHGGETIFNNVETEDGQVIDRLTVAQYIYYSLADDELTLGNQLYDSIVEEAVKKCEELMARQREEEVGQRKKKAVSECEEQTDFDTEHYFTHHEDIEISQLAAALSVDHFQLSKSQQVAYDKDTLREQTQRLLMDFRLDYAEAQLRELKAAISKAVNDPERMIALMKQYQEMQKIRNELAKKLGNNIVI